MKKRLLAMLLAVVTTITSVPTPVYAAADDAVVDYVDEETDAEDAFEEIVPDTAEEIEVTEAAPAEEAVAEETTEAAPAADEAVAEDSFVEEAAPEVTAAPADETVSEEAGDAEIKKEMTEEDAVTFTDTAGWRRMAPNAASLYGDNNIWFTEGEWDYQGGIYDDMAIYVNPSNSSMINNNKYTAVLEKNSDKPAYSYKFSLAEGWNKEKRDSLNYTELKPGELATVGGLQVMANNDWLYKAGQPEKVNLVKDKDYYVDADENVWIYDSYGVGRKLTKQYWFDSEVREDGFTYRYYFFTWDGFNEGVWWSWDPGDPYDEDFENNVYQEFKVDAESKEEPVSEFYVFDTDHNTKSKKIHYDYTDTPLQRRDLVEGVDYVVKEDVVYIIEDDGTENPLDADGFIAVDANNRTNRYETHNWCSFDDYTFNGYLQVYREAKLVGAEWVEYGPYYGQFTYSRTGVSFNSVSVVSVNKAGVYTLKSEITYTVSRNTVDGNDLIGDDEIVTVTDVGYMTIFVRIKDDVNAGWGKLSYELKENKGTDKETSKKYVENINDYSKIAGLEADAKYRVEWNNLTKDVVPTITNACNNIYTADKNGEIKSDKYWAPNDDTGLWVYKISDAEANGNCDSWGRNLYLDEYGATFFDKIVFVEKTAPGLYGDSKQNNYNADEKESVKVDGIYGDNKFLYMKDTLTALDFDPVGDTNGIAYKADATKGTIEIYPMTAGIGRLTADIQYAFEYTDNGVKNSKSLTTGSETPVIMIINEAVPQGRVVGTDKAWCYNPETDAYDIQRDCLKIAGLEYGKYRIRAVSDNSILKNVIVGDDADGEYTIGFAAANPNYNFYENVDVMGIDGAWTTNVSHYLLIDSSVLKEDQVKDKGIYLEKVNADNEALNAKQTLLLSAEEVYVNIIPPMAGHTPVNAADVEKGTLYTKNLNNIGISNVFNMGQEGPGNGYNFFYNVTDVKWDGALKDGYFEKDKVYSATVTMTISSNETISSNVAFSKDIKPEDIHINAGMTLRTDAYPAPGPAMSIAVDPANIKIDDSTKGTKTLKFTVTFPKAFLQYEVSRINVTANGRLVTGYNNADDNGLADPVIYVAPGQEVPVTVDAINRAGVVPSYPTISVNSPNLTNGKFLWDDDHFSQGTRNVSGRFEDPETGATYRFQKDAGVSTFNVWCDNGVDPLNVHVTYDVLIKDYIMNDKYVLTAWADNSNTAQVVFTISGNAAASGEDKISFTAQDGTVETRQITIRYYKKADTPTPDVEYDRVIKDKNAPYDRLGANEEHIGDFITKLKPHTWYIISWLDTKADNDPTNDEEVKNSFYSDSQGDIFVAYNDWYITEDVYPISISEAYGEQPQKSASDPVDVYIKRTLNLDKLYARVDAPVDGGNPTVPADGWEPMLYNTELIPVAVTISENSAKWIDETGKTMEWGTDKFEKGKKYSLSFVVRLQKYGYDENNAWNPTDNTKGESIYRGLNNVTVSVPGDIVEKETKKESVSQDYLFKDKDGKTADDSAITVTANFNVADVGKVPVALAAILVENNSVELATPYNRSIDGGVYVDYPISEGWKLPEGEVKLDLNWERYPKFPGNADAPEAVVYADATGSVDTSVSMNDAAGKKTRAQISGNKVVGERAQIKATIYNKDGSEVANEYVLDDVYVKLAAPYNATNVDDSKYITGLEKDATYVAYSDVAGQYAWNNENAIYYNRYAGKAYEYTGQGEKKDKSFTGFKRLSSWTDGATVTIRKTYQGDETHVASSLYDSFNVTVKLSKLIPKKGLYVTWPYGMTDDTRSYVYDGGKKTPTVWVWYDGERLSDNFYKVTYKNNVNVSTEKKRASITVTGKNGVKGKANVMYFDITPAQIDWATTWTTDGYSNTITVKKGTELKKIKFNLYWGSYSKALKAKKDYTVESTTTKFNEDGWILVTGKGNFEGTKLIKVIVADTLYNKLNINLANKGKVEYNYYKDRVAWVKPSMTVTAGKGSAALKLTEGLDYKIYVEENTKANGAGVHNVGTYKVYVFGQGIYGNNGKAVMKKFKITPKKLQDVEVNMAEIAAWEAGYQYDNIMGTTLERGLNTRTSNAPALKIVADNVDLKYSYNSKKYVKYDEYGYRKEMGKKVGYNNAGAEMTFKYVDSVSVKYQKNKKLGTAKYTINFGGNFKGTKPIKGGEFKIKETVLETNAAAVNGNKENIVDTYINPNAWAIARDEYHNKLNEIVIPDVVYTGKAGTYFSNPMIFYYNDAEGVDGYAGPKQILYKKGRDYTVRYFKDATYKDEITAKNKLQLTPGQEYANVYVRIEGKGGYSLSTYALNRAIDTSYRVYDPKKVAGGCIDLKGMKYYNGEAKAKKIKLQYTPEGIVVTSGSGKKLETITNNMIGDGYEYDAILRSSDKAPNWQLSMYGVGDNDTGYRLQINGRVVGYRNMKVTVSGTLEKEWFR